MPMLGVDAVPVEGTLTGHERCRSCGEPFAWAFTHKKKRMPIDVEPTVDGNLALMREGTVYYVSTLGPGDVARGARYVTHFATCPNAKEHRR